MEILNEESATVIQKEQENEFNEKDQRKSSQASSFEIQSTEGPNSATLQSSDREASSPIRYFNDQAISRIAFYNLKQSFYIVHEYLKQEQHQKQTCMKRIVSQQESIHKLQSEQFTSQDTFSTEMLQNSLPIQQKLTANLKLVSSSFQLPDVKLKSTDPKLSADTVYIGSNIIGIADGVSQWKQFNINPKYFGENLIQAACQYIKDNVSIPQHQESFDFEDLGRNAFKQGATDNNCSGSATILICYLKNQHLFINSLGDVQLAIYRPVLIEGQSRKFEQIYKSKTQLVAFNSPQQFIKLPSASFQQMLGIKQRQGLQNLISKFKKSDNLVPVKDALIEKVKVRPGDVLVTGCDGLWDNLFDNEILDILAQNQSESIPKFEESASKHLAKMASDYSKSKERISPFAEEARKLNLSYVGGKPDDISVIVSTIQVDQI